MNINSLKLEKWLCLLVCSLIFLIPIRLFPAAKFGPTGVDLITLILLVLHLTLLISIWIKPIFVQEFFLTIRLIATLLDGQWGMLWVGWMMLGVIWTKHPAIVWVFTVQNGACLTVALVTAHLIRKSWQGYFFISLMGSAALQSLIAIAQHFHQGSLGLLWLGERPHFQIAGDVFRSYGLTAHPNLLAFFLLVSVFSLLVYLASTQRWYMGITLLPMLLALLYTGSRANIASLLIGFSLCGSVWLWQARWLYRSLLILSTPLLLLLVLRVIPTTLTTRLDFLMNQEHFQNRLTYAYADTLYLIEQEPLLGLGGGVLRYGNLSNPDVAHNVLLIIWAEQGILGLTFYVMMVFSFLNRLHPKNSWSEFILTMGFLSINLTMLFDVQITMANYRLLIFWYMGCIWGEFLLRETLQLPSLKATVYFRKRLSRKSRPQVSAIES